MSSKDQLAGASISGVTERYAQLGRVDWQGAMQEIQDVLKHYKIPADSIREVLAHTAAAYLDGRWYADKALALLVDAGADLTRAREIHEQDKKRRVIQIGDARLGGR